MVGFVIITLTIAVGGTQTVLLHDYIGLASRLLVAELEYHPRYSTRSTGVEHSNEHDPNIESN